MLGVAFCVWVLIFRCWREVDIYIMLEDGDAPPRTLFEMREYTKAMQNVPAPGGVIYEEERGIACANSKQ